MFKLLFIVWLFTAIYWLAMGHLDKATFALTVALGNRIFLMEGQIKKIAQRIQQAERKAVN